MTRRLYAGLAFLLLTAAAPAASTPWRPVGPADANLNAVALPASQVGVLYASRSDSHSDSLNRSTDDGATWDTVRVPIGGCGFNATPFLATDPVQAGKLYATRGTNLLVSEDGGATWQETASPGVGWLVRLIAAPGRLLALGDSSGFPPLSPRPPCYPDPFSNGIARSADGGATWTLLPLPPAGSARYTAVAVDPVHPERLYFGTSSGDAFVSLDGGATLTLLPGISSVLISDLRIDSSASTLFAVAAGVIFRAVLQADGSVGEWTRLVPAPEVKPLSGGSLVLDPHQPGRLYVLASQGVFVSTDRGDSWQSIGDGLDPLSIDGLSLDPRPNGPLYAATRQGLYALDRSHCAVDAASTCLSGFRYRVAASFTLPGGTATAAHPRALSADTADVWFFAPGNIELLVKVLDGRSVNGDFWVFAGGLSDVRYTLTVTDTETGAVQAYTKPAGRLASFADTSAFPVGATKLSTATAAITAAAPAAFATSATSGCAAGGTTLCLSGSRFTVAVSYSAGPFAGLGHTIPLTDDTGAFWFLTPENLELAVKVLDGRGVNGRFWVFYGALSDFAYTLTVTDTETGAVRTYANPRGHLASFADTSAF